MHAGAHIIHTQRKEPLLEGTVARTFCCKKIICYNKHQRFSESIEFNSSDEDEPDIPQIYLSDLVLRKASVFVDEGLKGRFPELLGGGEE